MLIIMRCKIMQVQVPLPVPYIMTLNNLEKTKILFLVSNDYISVHRYLALPSNHYSYRDIVILCNTTYTIYVAPCMIPIHAYSSVITKPGTKSGIWNPSQDHTYPMDLPLQHVSVRSKTKVIRFYSSTPILFIVLLIR